MTRFQELRSVVTLAEATLLLKREKFRGAKSGTISFTVYIMEVRRKATQSRIHVVAERRLS